MKKALSITIALLLIAISVFPAFAESVTSPKATKADYIVEEEESEGGHADIVYDTSVQDDGSQKITITGVPDEGYDFIGWEINGSYTTNGALTDKVLQLIISGDVKIKPKFAKKGAPEEPTKKAEPKIIDDGTKSPQTGSSDFAPYAVLFVSAAALVAIIFVAKRRSNEE